MATGPTLTVETPTRSPLRGGLLAVANVIEVTDVHAGNGVNYLAHPAGAPLIAPGLFWPLIKPADPAAPKVTNGIDSVETDPFALYYGVKAGLMFSEDYAERAVQGLEFNESYGVEGVVDTALFAAARAAAGATPAVSLVKGLAALESIATIGLLTIHANRALTTHLIEDRLVTEDSEFRISTRQGSPVANGATAGKYWLYATGQVNIWRGAIVASQAQNPSYNTAMALAERIYSITIDGSVTAVLVDINL